MATAVIGREHELGTIQAFLGQAADGPRGLVLSGEPGIGKTILWEAGVDEAEERHIRVLTCRSVEAEATLSFAGLSDLLGDVIGEATPALAPPRRRALEVALLLAEPADRAPDAHAIGLALLDVLRVLAANGPVLVAFDDAQWVDPSSAGALQLALRRLRLEPITMLATLRVGPEIAARFPLDRSFAEDRFDRLSLDPLSSAALHTLLKERLGLELTRLELTRVREATGGNPFFALEFGRELVRTGSRPTAGRALRVPESLRDLLGGRLARLPGETLDVLLLIAALARPTVELVAAAHGDRKRVLAALEAGVREGVVELDDSRLRFQHPLLASICYERAAVWKRRAVHRALASTVGEVEERARHLALAAEGPDAGIASELDSAAEQAAARGATATAADLFELAAELTPDDPALVRQRRLRAANFHRLAGDADRASAMLEQLLEEVPAGIERADVLFPLIMLFRGGAPTKRLFVQALADAEGDDARSARILANRAGFHLFDADLAASLADGRAALEKAERVGDSALLAAVIARVATVEGYVAEVTPGLLERGVDLEQRLGLAFEYYESPRYAFARLLMRLGEIEQPRMLLRELEAQAAARGDEGTRMMVLWTLGLLEWFAGRWQVARDCANAAYELTEQIQHSHGRVWVARVKALIEADLGLADQARASVEEGLAFSQTMSEFHTILAHGTLGHLELALGDVNAAATQLRDLPKRLLAAGLHDPTVPLWSDAIESLVAVGEIEPARALLEQHEENARRLGSAGAIACAARCRGLVCAAEGDVVASFAAFEHALAEQPEPGWPFERGRTLLCLGIVRRQAQQKKAAREALTQALAIFEELGAPLWMERARVELRRISGRQAASSALTETEQRVAELAVRGRSNKEIAAELFMGRSTVEAHLSRVYRKLDVRSRTELARTLPASSAEGRKSMEEVTQP